MTGFRSGGILSGVTVLFHLVFIIETSLVKGSGECKICCLSLNRIRLDSLFVQRSCLIHIQQDIQLVQRSCLIRIQQDIPAGFRLFIITGSLNLSRIGISKGI